MWTKFYTVNVFGFSLEYPQGVGIVGTVGIVGIEFYRLEPRPTTHSVLVDISCYSYLKEQKFKYTDSASLSFKIKFLCLLCNWYNNYFVINPESFKQNKKLQTVSL